MKRLGLFLVLALFVAVGFLGFTGVRAGPAPGVACGSVIVHHASQWEAADIDQLGRDAYAAGAGIPSTTPPSVASVCSRAIAARGEWFSFVLVLAVVALFVAAWPALWSRLCQSRSQEAETISTGGSPTTAHRTTRPATPMGRFYVTPPGA